MTKKILNPLDDSDNNLLYTFHKINIKLMRYQLHANGDVLIPDYVQPRQIVYPY